MAIYPWRFQSDVKPGETDPVVTVFVGPERAVLDDNGDPVDPPQTVIQQDTSGPITVPLSQLATTLSGPVTRSTHKP